MEKLDLSSCTTNKQVCELVSARVRSIPFETYIKDVEANFVFQKEPAKALYTGLANNMNVLLSGSGGYGKSSLIRFVLEYFGIPYTIVAGYKDMPVDALLGLPDMRKLLEDSSYQIKFEESAFYSPGILVGEEFTDILPATAAALKEILTSKGFHTKTGKIESLISTMIVAGNKSANEIADDDSKKAFYKERFPLQEHVGWENHSKENYMKFLKLKFPDAKAELLNFLSYLFENNHLECNNTISPRIAGEIAKVYLKDGLNFISSFSVDLEHFNKVKEQAKEDIIITSLADTMDTIEALLKAPSTASDTALKTLYAMHKLADVVVTNSNAEKILNSRLVLNGILTGVKGSIPSFIAIDQVFSNLVKDEA
jgi:MoxR-like ATPase